MSRARLALALGTTCAALLAFGCNNEDDSHLWGGEMSPTQIQNAQMSPGPVGVLEVDDGDDNQDPFTDNPGYPYTEEPWGDN